MSNQNSFIANIVNTDRLDLRMHFPSNQCDFNVVFIFVHQLNGNNTSSKLLRLSLQYSDVLLVLYLKQYLTQCSRCIVHQNFVCKYLTLKMGAPFSKGNIRLKYRYCILQTPMCMLSQSLIPEETSPEIPLQLSALQT